MVALCGLLWTVVVDRSRQESMEVSKTIYN